MSAKNDYEKLGKAVEDVLKGEFHSTPRLIYRHFIGGIFAGLGGVIGATIMVGILLFFLGLLDNLPGIGRYFDNISNQIESRQPKQ
jgi:Fe2+ transport system protein B